MSFISQFVQQFGQINSPAPGLGAVPTELAVGTGRLITILEAAGIAFIIYVIFIAVRTVFMYRNNKRIRIIQKKVEDIDAKLDKILKKKK